MIVAKGKQVSVILAKGKVIAAVYKGARLVWQSVRSCFGSGRWINEKPWLDAECWKNN